MIYFSSYFSFKFYRKRCPPSLPPFKNFDPSIIIIFNIILIVVFVQPRVSLFLQFSCYSIYLSLDLTHTKKCINLTRNKIVYIASSCSTRTCDVLSGRKYPRASQNNRKNKQKQTKLYIIPCKFFILSLLKLTFCASLFRFLFFVLYFSPNTTQCKSIDCT
jgi:hypothetical protein